MPRGRKITKIIREPDLKYKSRVVTKFINLIMEDGKKSVAQEIVYSVMDNLNKDDIKEARNYFEEAIKNVMPEVEVRSRRVGGANYQIPIPVKYDRAETLAMRWILTAARNKKGAPMVNKLTAELKDASKNEGSAIKKKQDTHRMADANKAFAHFRW